MNPLRDPSKSEVKPYDFEQQEALERGRLRRLGPLLEVLGHRIAGALTSLLRMPVIVEIGELDQHRFEHWVSSLPEPTFLSSAAIVPIGGRIVLHLPLSLATAVVEVQLGGTGGGGAIDRQLTEIEVNLVDSAARDALAELPPSFAPVITFGIGAMTSVQSPMFLQVAKPQEMCLVISMAVVLGEGENFEASLLVPLSIVLPILDAIERLESAEGPGHEDRASEDVRRRLLEVPIEATVAFPSLSMSPEQLLGLMPGDVVALEQPEGAPLNLNVSGTQYCHVVPVTKGRRLACMVVEPAGGRK
jgi:flagellar motor switch protein FliM